MIRNIIFDFGGVIYDIDFQRSMLEFHKLGLGNFDQLYSKAIQDKLFDKLETAELSNQEFRNELKKSFPENVGDNQIDAAWNALLIGFVKERLDLLNQVKDTYNIYLLSNTNNIHYQVFLKEFQDMTGHASFNDLFVKAYFSFEIHCRKPDLAPYEFVISDAKLNPAETLFIDDSYQNIAPAKEVGLKTCFLDLNKGEDLRDLFENGKLKQGVYSE